MESKIYSIHIQSSDTEYFNIIQESNISVNSQQVLNIFWIIKLASITKTKQFIKNNSSCKFMTKL